MKYTMVAFAFALSLVNVGTARAENPPTFREFLAGSSDSSTAQVIAPLGAHFDTLSSYCGPGQIPSCGFSGSTCEGWCDWQRCTCARGCLAQDCNAEESGTSSVYFECISGCDQSRSQCYSDCGS